MTKLEQQIKMKELAGLFKKAGWSHDYKDEYFYIVRFTRVTDGVTWGFYIRLDQYTNRIKVSVCTIRSTVDSSWYWTPDVKSVGMSFDKPTFTLLNDIMKRFLNDEFFKQSEHEVKRCIETEQLIIAKRNLLKSACKVAGIEQHNKTSEVASGYIDDKNEKYLKIQSYRDGLKIELDGITLEQFAKIIEVVTE